MLVPAVRYLAIRTYGHIWRHREVPVPFDGPILAIDDRAGLFARTRMKGRNWIARVDARVTCKRLVADSPGPLLQTTETGRAIQRPRDLCVENHGALFVLGPGQQVQRHLRPRQSALETARQQSLLVPAPAQGQEHAGKFRPSSGRHLYSLKNAWSVVPEGNTARRTTLRLQMELAWHSQKNMYPASASRWHTPSSRNPTSASRAAR